MERQSAHYRYTDLPPGNYIRHLILEPGLVGDELQGRLAVCPLDSASQFEAISYAWGDPTRSYQMCIEGHALLVTKNLIDVLSQVRSPSHPRRLWVDSVCINQNDNAEKSVQVAMMGYIFSTATRVLICLGADPDCFDDAEAAASLVTSSHNGLLYVLQAVRGWNAFPELQGSEPILSDSRIPSLRRLINQPWFKRGWTVQESVLARDARVLWGHAEMNWFHLVRLCVWARRVQQLIISFGIGFLTAIHFLSYFREYRHEAMVFMVEEDYRSWSDELSYLDIMDCMRGAQVSDPRDRIFAFLGLIEKFCARSLSVRVDYQKSCAEVFFDVASDYFSSTGNAFILHYIHSNNWSLENSVHPSWVPCWDRFCYRSIISNYHRMNEIKSCTTASPPVILGKDLLKVRGVIFDKLRYVPHKTHGNMASLDDMLESWNDVSSVHRSNTPYQNLPPLVAFLYTLWAERGPNNNTCTQWKSTFAYARWIHDRTDYQAATGLYSTPGYHPPDGYSEDHALGLHEYFRQRNLLSGRRYFLTQRGYYGMGSPVARRGDLCCVIFGGTKAPFIIRETDIPGRYKIIGDYTGVSHLLSPAGCIQWFGQQREWDTWDLEEQDILLC